MSEPQENQTQYKLIQSKRKNKKYALVIKVGTKKGRSFHFGDDRYEDYTTHKDAERQQQYIKRHTKEQKYWSHTKENLQRPSYLSRFILWEAPSLAEAIKFVEKHQQIKIQADF